MLLYKSDAPKPESNDATAVSEFTLELNAEDFQKIDRGETLEAEIKAPTLTMKSVTIKVKRRA